MKIAIVSTDNREHFKTYDWREPDIPTPQAALLDGFAALPDIEVHFISCSQQPVLSPEKLADNIWFHSLHVPKTGWMRTLYQGCVRAVRKKLKEIQPDIVHGQGTERDAGMCAVLSGFPNVVTLHGIMREQARLSNARPGSFYWLATLLESFVLRRTAGVFCNSEYTESVVRPRSRRTWRVPNAVRQAFFDEPVRCSPSGDPILLNVGMVCPRKRQNELVAVARELNQDGAKFKIHFLGMATREKPYGAQFLDSVEQNRAFLSFPGFKPTGELIQSFDAASALVHVPSEESFGLVVAEALARNLKFFGFKVGGVADIVQDVDGAELVADGDWRGLKNAIKSWLQAGAPRLESARAVMRKKYHPEVVAARHMEIYREVLSKRS
jgi:glycosyltransferase involved in cell wall biosynthesis